MGRRTNLILPDELVREVDRVAGPRNRSRFVADAVRDRLRRERLREAWDASFGAIMREEHPEWATPKLVESWVRALRAEETTDAPGDSHEGRDPGSEPREVGAPSSEAGLAGSAWDRGGARRGRGASAR